MSIFDFFKKKPAKKANEPQKAQPERFKAQSRQSGIGSPAPARKDDYSPSISDQSIYYATSSSESCGNSSHDYGSSSSSYDSCSSSSDSSSSCSCD